LLPNPLFDNAKID